MYTIGQVSEMFGLPISTLRYYDKQGLFPEMERVSGMSANGLVHLQRWTMFPFRWSKGKRWRSSVRPAAAKAHCCAV